MKLKRFLTLIALIILTMIMLTGCGEEDTNPKVLMKFDSQTITLKSDQKGYAYLEVDVKDGDYEGTFTKRFEVSENQTLTIGIEDIAKDFFSENAQICNVKVKTVTDMTDMAQLVANATALIIIILIILVALVF